MNTTSAFWNETLQLALQALRANKVRAMLTMLGVIIGSACIVLVVTVGLAGKRYIISEIEGVGSNLVLAEALNPGGSQSVALSDQITPGDLQAVEQDIPQVVRAAGTNDIRMSVTVGGTVHPISLVGVTQDFNAVRRLVVVKGRYFDQDDMTSRSKVCLITEQLATSMFPYDQPVGKDLAIGELHFTVIGVFKERVATFGETEITPESVIIPFPLIKDYTGADYFKSFYAQADGPEDVPLVTQRVSEVLTSRHRPGAKYHVWNLTSILEAAKNISMALTFVLILIALIALTISGIGIMNIMLVTVTERTREIGIRKAIGAPRSAILYQFLAEAVLISGTGALAGIAIGVLIPVLANFLIAFTPVAGDIVVPISWMSVVLAFVVSCSTGVVFGYLPANRAAQLQPTESLRYE
ncbi:MAG TPA: ABC transporter permease [Candidatus Limnocylindrales bacterium]|nr:ABC transporter permease [Candidatus Limnocylindrales bacterium]